MMTMPATVPAPVTAMPAPMTVVPAVVMSMAPAMTVTPTHLFRLEMIDFVFGGDGGMGVLAGCPQGVIVQRMRRQRRGLGTGAKCGGARGDAQGKLQKVSAFHHIFPPLESASDANGFSVPRHECWLNRAFRFIARTIGSRFAKPSHPAP